MSMNRRTFNYLIILIVSLFIFNVHVFAVSNTIKVGIRDINKPVVGLSNKCNEPRLTINPTIDNEFAIGFYSSVESLVSGWMDCYIQGIDDLKDLTPYFSTGKIGDYSFSAADKNKSGCTEVAVFDAWKKEKDVPITTLGWGGDKCTIACYNDPSCDIIKECDVDMNCSFLWFLGIISYKSEIAKHLIDNKGYDASHFHDLPCPEGMKNCYILPDLYNSDHDIDGDIYRELLLENPSSEETPEDPQNKYIHLFFGSWPAQLDKSSYTAHKQVETFFSIKANTFKDKSTYICYPKITSYLYEDWTETPDKYNGTSGSFQIETDSTYNEEEYKCNVVNPVTGGFDPSIKCDGLDEKSCKQFQHCTWDGGNGKCIDGYVAANPCSENSIKRVLKIFGFLIFVAKIAVPLIIIGLGTFDLFKAVVDKDEKSFGKQVKQLIIRVVTGLMVFFVPNIVNAAFSLSNKFGIIEDDKYATCRSCVLNPTNNSTCNTK